MYSKRSLIIEVMKNTTFYFILSIFVLGTVTWSVNALPDFTGFDDFEDIDQLKENHRNKHGDSVDLMDLFQHQFI